ncbi:MAG TPA: chorismate mutase, partial [Bacteroidales bacterium]|nr:chorismate mutase [Bacteroidales bacterium]
MSPSEILRVRPISNWLRTVRHPFVISGPCSAENQKQVLETALGLASTGLVSVLRAGVWKPRTRPHSFEGKGEEALQWLIEARDATGLPVAVEVASPTHIELCLKYDIDMVWIGARTSVNPFSVQEIADALFGTELPVLVKNPVNPDIKLWIGAIERIYQAGIDQIIAVHRGFNTYDDSVFRNAPLWEIPIELKRIFPGLPIICDPSHIAGTRRLLLQVAQHAMDLDFDGLMLESHCNPELALTDADQQLTPEGLLELVNNLVLRRSGCVKGEPTRQLETYRRHIDEIDRNILYFLSKRMEMVEKIGELKKENNITILQI